MNYRIASAKAVRYPVLQITFEDGLTGDYDLTGFLRGEAFEPLRNHAFFEDVSVAPGGRTFGWRLDQPGQELDFCGDAARIHVETAIVGAMAASFRARQAAAE